MTLERVIVLIILVALAIFLLRFLFGMGDGDAALIAATLPITRLSGSRTGWS